MLQAKLPFPLRPPITDLFTHLLPRRMVPDLGCSGLEESLDVSYKPTPALPPDSRCFHVVCAVARESLILPKRRTLRPTLSRASNVIIKRLLLAPPALEEFEAGDGFLQRDVIEVERGQEIFLVLLEEVRR